MTPLIEKARNHPLLREHSAFFENVPCFDAGKAPENFFAANLPVPPVHLPFSPMVIIWSHYPHFTLDERDLLILWAKHQDGKVFVEAVCTTANDLYVNEKTYFVYDTDPKRVFDIKDNYIGICDGSNSAHLALYFFLERLEQSSQTAYIPTPKANSLINKKRIAKGKPPLQFEWRTVVIEPKRAQSVSKGGTHAPPRLHTRRGHYRKYKSGKRVWIRDCMVGDPTKGFVKHDYKVVTHHDPSD